MNENDCLVEQYELKKNSSYCVHFTGDINKVHQLSKCFRYCSYCEAKGLMQSEEPLVRSHGALRQKRNK